MPLRAIIDGEDVIAPFYSDEEWNNLKKRVKAENLEVLISCCGNPAYLRTSKQGVHHFVHKRRGDCTTQPETWQHLKAKQEILLACRDAGFEASTEVEGDGWRADILATKGKAQIAFEVQWSKQTLEVTRERQQKFKDAGVRGCWFFKTPPPNTSVLHELPLFKLNVTEDACTVIFNPDSYQSEYKNQEIPLQEFVSILLSGKLKFCDHLNSMPTQNIQIVFVETTCWKCLKPFHVYFVKSARTACGDELNLDEFDPQVVAIAREYTRSPEGRHIKLGYIKKRYSNTVKHSYVSFGCPHCDAIVGKFYLRTDILLEAYYVPDEQAPGLVEKLVTLSEPPSEEHPHWCYSESKQFCCKW